MCRALCRFCFKEKGEVERNVVCLFFSLLFFALVTSSFGIMRGGGGGKVPQAHHTPLPMFLSLKKESGDLHKKKLCGNTTEANYITTIYQKKKGKKKRDVNIVPHRRDHHRVHQRLLHSVLYSGVHPRVSTLIQPSFQKKAKKAMQSVMLILYRGLRGGSFK